MLRKIKSAFGYTATNKVVTKEAEYQLYEKVSQDIAKGERDEGVWTSAFAKSEGDNQKAEAKYIDLMVQRYKDWIEAGMETAEILHSSFEEKEKEKERQEELKQEELRKEELRRAELRQDEDFKRSEEARRNSPEYAEDVKFVKKFMTGVVLVIFVMIVIFILNF